MAVGYRDPAAATGTASSFVGPAFTAATNEVAILRVMLGSTSLTCSTPAGWTLVYQTTGTISRTYIFTRTTTDAGSTFTLSGSVAYSYTYAVVTGTTGLSGSALTTSSASSSSISADLPATSGYGRLFAFAGFEAAAGLTQADTTALDPVASATALAGVQQGLYYLNQSAESLPATSYGTFGPGGPYHGGGNYGEVRGLHMAAAAQPPLAPMLMSIYTGPLANPTTIHSPSGSSMDLANVSHSISWQFNREVQQPSVDTQQSYAFRRKVVGAGAYEYWNAGTATWQAGEVYNISGTTSVTFPTGKWTSNTAYQYAVATKGSATGAAGPYCPDATVFASIPPAVTITGPTGAGLTVSAPTVTWSYTDADGNPQGSFYVFVYPTSVTAQSGFTPGQASGRVAYSGQVQGTATSWALASSLATGTSYTAYATVVDNVGSGYQGGATRSSGFVFTLNVNTPATPALTAGAQTGGAVSLTFQGRDNALSENQASLESDTTGWAARTNATIARSTSYSQFGGASLAVTSVAAGGEASATTPTGLSGAPIAPLAQYTLMAHLSVSGGTFSGGTAVAAEFFDSTGATITSTSMTIGNFAAPTFSQAKWTFTTPANAAYAAVRVLGLSPGAGGITLYADGISLAPGNSASFTRGGLVGTTKATIERSADGGATWAPILTDEAVALPAQTVTFIDATYPLGAALKYRASTSAEV